MVKIKVVIVDDHTIIRRSLRLLIEQNPEITVVAEADDGWGAIEQTKNTSPDIVLLDVRMPNLNGIDACLQIRRDYPDTKVIALSIDPSTDTIKQMFQAGASGYLVKYSEPAELFEAIKAVAEGQSYLPPELAGPVTNDYTNSGNSRHLSTREREVLQMLSEGMSTKLMAEKLKLSVKTIETHRHNIMEKTNLYSIAQLTKYAIKIGLTSASI